MKNTNRTVQGHFLHATLKYPILMLLILSLGRAESAQNLGLCTSVETRFFSCATNKSKQINLCGTSSGDLQYRFGRVGKTVFSYPANATEGKDRFLFSRYSRFQTERIEVSFRNADVDYILFDYTENGQRQAGIRLSAGYSKESTISCTANIHSKLIELKPVLRCDADNALNGGKCP